MTGSAISVQGVWKEYVLGRNQSHQSTFYELLSHALRAPLGLGRDAPLDSDEHLWALRDVNFEVRAGEILGVIGGNGAGKSTLLKTLSRITAPTRGRIEVRGRLASLLEVGTGFHPELSGRENIFLNGAVLGMSRRDVTRKFDDIVEFADVAKFLDTPVKRYSSGMYVRLAFAVAAHLESDVLLVDEVLAVGDAEFQKRCLGKMSQVASSGRTILFVSHNMGAIMSLCTRAIALSSGRIVADGETAAVIAGYLAREASSSNEILWDAESAPGERESILLRAVRLTGGTAHGDMFSSEDPPSVEFEFDAAQLGDRLCIGFDVLNSDGVVLMRSYQTDEEEGRWPRVAIGSNKWSCKLPRDLLNGGTFYIAARIGIHNQRWIVHSDPLLKVDVALQHGDSPLWEKMKSQSRPGIISPVLTWHAHTKVT